MRALLTLFSVLLAGGSASAQVERYELGQRLKTFEKQWDKTTDEKILKKAAEGLPKLTGLYFAGQLGHAGQTLDSARWILEGSQPKDADRWAQSLFAVPQSRLVTSREKEFVVTVKEFYRPNIDRWTEWETNRKAHRVKISMPGAFAERTVVIDGLQTAISLRPLAKIENHDGMMTIEFLADGKILARREIPISVRVDDPELAVLKTATQGLTTGTIEWATAKDRREMIGGVAKGEMPETDCPVEKLLAEVVQMQALAKESKPYFTQTRPGQFWLSIPGGKNNTPGRLFVPEGLDVEKPVPIVIALHGAGGSENLFFEGYGDGQILKLCQKRGWMLVSPRSGLSLVGGGPAVGEIVDELAKRYPIDPKRVFIVGHSMGAMQAIDAVQKYPGKFAGLAAFGGDGRVRKAEIFTELPTFIGVGDKDFALKQVRALNKTLTDGGAKAVTYREYEGIEHMLICREALPDAFAMFDTLSEKKK